MDETLKQYMLLFKQNSDLVNGPDYPGKEKDIQNQKEQIEAYENFCSKALPAIMIMMSLLIR